jgi:hypothetical protein
MGHVTPDMACKSSTVRLPLCVRGAATRDGAMRVLGHVAQVRGVSRSRKRERVGEG